MVPAGFRSDGDSRGAPALSSRGCVATIGAVNEPAGAPVPGGRRGRLLVPLAWLAVAIAVTLVSHLRQIDSPFNWTGAHAATMARSFVQFGVLELRGVPVENNPPLGLEPERYLHWPPLYPILLSGVFRLFGESEAVARALQLLLVLAQALLLFALGRAISSDARTGLLAAFAWLTIPVVAGWGYMVWGLQLALLATSLALWAFVQAVAGAFHRGWALLGAAALAVGVLASWEPLMMIPGLLVAAWWAGGRSRRRLALVYAGVGGFALVGILALYVVQAPTFAVDLIETLKYRAGISDPSSELTLRNLFIYSRHPQPPAGARFERIAHHVVTQAGPIALLAIAWSLWHAWRGRSSGRAGALVPVLAGWLSLPLLWGLVLSNHMLHRFEHTTFAPLAALSLGLAIVALGDASERADRRGLRLAGLGLAWVVLPSLLVVFGWRASHVRAEHAEPPDVRAYARAIESATAPDAVVVTAEESMVPVYYSRRHLWRAVANDAALDVSRPDLRRRFPCAPLYLALRPGRTGGFERSLRRYAPVHRSQALLLLELDPGGAAAARGCDAPASPGPGSP